MAESDWTLLSRFSQHGAHSAFATLVKRYRPLVDATCTRLLGSGSDADDVVQATFFQLARCAGQLTGSAPARRSLAPWLTRVATNICHDMARSRTARRNHEREYVRRCASATRSTTSGQLAPLVDELIAGLPQQLREPIVLCYLQGIEHATAAAQLGLTVGTLRRRIQSAKSLLRSRLAARGIPISMFLLHLVLDNRASGANALPSTGSAVPTAAEPRTPPNHLPPQVTQRPFARPFRRPVTGSGACWAVTAGLIAVTIGTIPVLYGVLSGDAPAFATADRVIREVPAEVVAAPAAAPPLVDDDTAPAIAAQAPGPDATDVFAPEVADSPASIETDAARETVFDAAPESVPPFTPVVASTSGPSTTMETPEMGVIPVPEELPVVFVTSEGESPAPDTAVKSAAKKPAGHPGKVKELFGIEWHTTLQNASAAARGEPARPIFCFCVLGHLSGFM